MMQKMNQQSGGQGGINHRIETAKRKKYLNEGPLRHQVYKCFHHRSPRKRKRERKR